MNGDWELTLFVSGASDMSARAIAAARRLCDTHLDGRYRLSVIDIHEASASALAAGVLAAPTLVRDRPLPVRRFVGDPAHTSRVLRALEIRAAPGAAAATG